MNCPNCGRKFQRAPENKVILNNSQEHLWGICQYCKEVAHFVHTPKENTVYSWIERKETPYAKALEVLLEKKYVLYITSGVAEASLVEVCRDFASSHGENVGFVVSYEYAEKAEIVNAVHRTVAIPEQLFPEKPSFIAEKLIIENTTGKLFTVADTISERFEKIKV